MPVGTAKDVPGLLHQELAILECQRRHRPLLEERNLRLGQAEVLVLPEERLGVLVRHRRGHHQQRHWLAVTPAQGEHFVGVDLKQRLVGNRADLEQPLGFVEPQTGALPARDQQHGHLARRQRGMAQGRRVGRDRLP